MSNISLLLQIIWLVNSQTTTPIKENHTPVSRIKVDYCPPEGGYGDGNNNDLELTDINSPKFNPSYFIQKNYCTNDSICTYKQTDRKTIKDTGVENPYSIGNDADKHFTRNTLRKGLNLSHSQRKVLDCGPVAVASIIDFFGYNLKIKEIYNLSENDYNSQDRSITLQFSQQKAATLAFNNTKITPLPNGSAYATPLDIEEGFNKSMKDYGIDKRIRAVNYATSTESQVRSEFETVKYSINKGFPLTVLHGSINPNNKEFGDFSNHCQQFLAMNVGSYITLKQKIQLKLIF